MYERHYVYVHAVAKFATLKEKMAAAANFLLQQPIFDCVSLFAMPI